MPNIFDSIPEDGVGVKEQPSKGNIFDSLPIDDEANIFDSIPTDDNPAPDQSQLGTLGTSWWRGLGQAGMKSVGGLAKLAEAYNDVQAKYTGIKNPQIFQPTADFTDDVVAESNRVYPTNYNNQIAETIGSGLAQGQTLLAGGALGKVAGLGDAALTNVPLFLGGAAGAGEGIDTAKELGIDSPEARLALSALFGGVEIGTEMLGGIGSKEASKALMDAYRMPAKEMLKEAAKSVFEEGGEEIAAGSLEDWLARAFATEDPNNPGYTKTGVKLPEVKPWQKEFLKKRGLEFLGGASGGAVFGGAQALHNLSKPIAPTTTELPPAEPQVAPAVQPSLTEDLDAMERMSAEQEVPPVTSVEGGLFEAPAVDPAIESALQNEVPTEDLPPLTVPPEESPELALNPEVPPHVAPVLAAAENAAQNNAPATAAVLQKIAEDAAAQPINETPAQEAEIPEPAIETQTNAVALDTNVTPAAGGTVYEHSNQTVTRENLDTPASASPEAPASAPVYETDAGSSPATGGKPSSAKTPSPTIDTPPAAESKVAEQVQAVAKEDGPRDAKAIKADILAQIDKAEKESIHGKAKKVTFDIPGDGTFTIWDTADSLAEMRKRVNRLPTTLPPTGAPSTAHSVSLRDLAKNIENAGDSGDIDAWVTNASNADEWSMKVVAEVRKRNADLVKRSEERLAKRLSGETKAKPAKPAKKEPPSQQKTADRGQPVSGVGSESTTSGGLTAAEASPSVAAPAADIVPQSDKSASVVRDATKPEQPSAQAPKTITKGDTVSFKTEGKVLSGKFIGSTDGGKTFKVDVDGKTHHTTARSLNDNNPGFHVEGTRYAMASENEPFPGGLSEAEDYRGSHRSPTGEHGEGSMDAMDRTYPDDLYSREGARYYGDGNAAEDAKIHRMILAVRGKPDAKVTVYRSAPKGKAAAINAGDWVTPSRYYAEMHGDRWEGGFDLLSKEVKAGDLFTEGNSLYEFGYSPKVSPSIAPASQYALPSGRRAMPLDEAQRYVYNKMGISKAKVRVLNQPAFEWRGRFNPDGTIDINTAFIGSTEELHDVLMNHEAIHDAIETSARVRNEASSLLDALTDDERADMESAIGAYKDAHASEAELHSERLVEAVRKLTANRKDLQSAWGRLVEAVSLKMKKLFGADVSRQEAELMAARILARGLKRLKEGATGGRADGRVLYSSNGESSVPPNIPPFITSRQSEPVGDNEKRGQAWGVEDIAQIHQQQSTELAKEAAKSYFNGAEVPLNEESTAKFYDIFGKLLDPKTGVPLAQSLIDSSNDMGPVFLQDQLGRYALRMAGEGDTTLFRQLLNNVNRMITGSLGNVSKSARDLSARRWSEMSKIFAGMYAVSESRNEAANKSGLTEEEQQKLQDELDAAKVQIEDLMRQLEEAKSSSGKTIMKIIDPVKEPEGDNGGKGGRRGRVAVEAEENHNKAEFDLEEKTARDWVEEVEGRLGATEPEGPTVHPLLKPQEPLVANMVRKIASAFYKGQMSEENVRKSLAELPIQDDTQEQMMDAMKADIAFMSLPEQQRKLPQAKALMQKLMASFVGGRITVQQLRDGLSKIEKIDVDAAVALAEKRKAANDIIRKATEPSKTAQAIVDAYVRAAMPNQTPPKENRTRTRIQQALQMDAPTVNRQQVFDTLKANLEANGVASALAESVAKITADAWQLRRSAKIKQAVENVSAKWLLQQVLGASTQSQQSPGWRQRVMADWLALAGFTPKEIERAVRILDAPFNKAMQDVRVAAVERYAKEMKRVLGISVKDKARLEKRVIPAIQRVTNALRAGSFEGVSEEMAKWANWTPLSAAELKRLNELDVKLEKFRNKKDGHEYLKAGHEMFNIFKDHVSGSALENFAHAFMLNLLSGLPTAGVNLVGPPLKIIGDAMIDIARSGANLDMGRFKAMVEALKTAANSWLKEARYTAKTDIADRHGVTEISTTKDFAHLDYQLDKWLRDLGQSVKNRDGNGILKGVMGISDIVRRFLTIADTAGTAAIKSYTMTMGAYDMLRKAGVSKANIANMMDAARQVYNDAYTAALMDGYSKEDADITAMDAKRDAILGFISKNVSPEKAFDLNKMARQEGFLAIGRKPITDDLAKDYRGNVITKQRGENLEGGLLSRLFVNKALDAISEFKYGGNTPDAKAFRAIFGTMMYGLVHVPYRTSRHFASYSPYGFVRVAAEKIRAKKGLDPWYAQSLATPEQQTNALWKASAGTALMLLIASLFKGSDEPDDNKDYITVTGSGPPVDDPAVRDAWIKSGNQPFHMRGRLFGVPFNVNIGRGGEISLMAALPFAVADDLRLKDKVSGYKSKKYESANIGKAMMTYVSAIAQKGGLGGLVDLTGRQTSPLSTPKGAAGAISNYASNVIPLNRFLQTTENLFINPPDKSTVETTITANIPIARLSNYPALNRLGEPVGDPSWLSKITYLGVPLPIDVAPTTRNKKVYEVIQAKMAAPGRMLRSDIERKYGPLTNKQWYDFVKTSGLMIASRIEASHDKLMKLPQAQVDKWMGDADDAARLRTARDMGLKMQRASR